MGRNQRVDSILLRRRHCRFYGVEKQVETSSKDNLKIFRDFYLRKTHRALLYTSRLNDVKSRDWAHSSVWLERVPDKDEVHGSNPCAPALKSFELWLEALFLYRDRSRKGNRQ